MDPALAVTFWFTVGMVIHILPKLRTSDDIKIFFIMLFITFFAALLPGKNEDVYDLHEHLVIFFFMSIVMIFFGLKEKLLPKVNELAVTFNTVIYLYALVYLVPRDWAWILGIAAVIPTGLVIHSIIERRELDPAIQTFLYFWNQAMFIVMFAVQYASFITMLPSWETAVRMPVVEIVSAGMMFAMIALPILGLLFLIPIPSKHQTMDERLAEIRDYLGHIVNHFTEENATPGKALFTVILTWGILTVNRMYHVYSDFSIISLLIIGIPFVIRLEKPSPPPPARIISMNPDTEQ